LKFFIPYKKDVAWQSKPKHHQKPTTYGVLVIQSNHYSEVQKSPSVSKISTDVLLILFILFI